MLGRILRRGRAARFIRELIARRRATGRSWRALWLIDTIPALLPLRALAGLHAARRGFRPIWRTRPINAAFAGELFARRAIDPRRLRQPAVTHLRWRARWRHLIGKTAAGAPGQAALAASLGLEITRPFHDKRVVELALAIPEALQLKHGLERYLARSVLGDRLPRRLLDRPPGNDAEDPDLFRAAREGAPAALAEARALDRGGRLSRYVDFDRVEATIAQADESRLADHARLHVAARAIVLARFIAWFDRSNG
jgi:asparagine synthase (glutamine-hydrolysing)